MPRPLLPLLFLSAVLASTFGCYVFGVDLPCRSDGQCSPTSVCRSGRCTVDDGALDAGVGDAGDDDAGPDDAGVADSGSIALETPRHWEAQLPPPAPAIGHT